jgi:hypothetical protein
MLCQVLQNPLILKYLLAKGTLQKRGSPVTRWPTQFRRDQGDDVVVKKKLCELDPQVETTPCSIITRALARRWIELISDTTL